MSMIDLSFLLTGKQVPADHGYLLYGGVTQHLPQLHAPQAHLTPSKEAREDDSLWGEVGIHPINGWLAGEGKINLTSRSRLTLRLDAARIADVMQLAGKRLVLGDDELRVGIPRPYALKPAARLYSRLVVIKGFMKPEPFLEAARRQLEEKGVNGRVGLVQRRRESSFEGRSRSSPERCPYVRRTICIRDKQVVGYAVTVDELSAEDSIRLQEVGIGGRRRFGCGIFVPDRR